MRSLRRSTPRMMTTGRKNGSLLLASLVLAMLAFIPAQAFAHPGHGHDTVKADSVNVIPSIKASGISATRSGDHAGLAGSRDLRSDTGLAKGKVCTSGCCQSAGPHCCPAFVSSDPGVFEAPSRALPFAPLVDRGAGINPGALSKPPKSLA